MGLFEDLYHYAEQESYTWEEASTELRDLHALSEAYYDALMEEAVTESEGPLDEEAYKKVAVDLAIQLFYIGRRYEADNDLVPLVLSRQAVQGLLERYLKE